ncbi:MULTISPECIES: glycosyl hydrolase 108 family protein [Mesorhizobium]|nr:MULTISPECIES: glycosyl hydrolase 108 family protein [Mesorhizobium]
MKGITTDKLIAIYDRQYWDAVRGDDLPAVVDYVVPMAL